MSTISKLSKSLKFKSLSKVSETVENTLGPKRMKILRDNVQKFKHSWQNKGNREELLRRYFIRKMGHFKYGLYTDDLITEDIPIVQEAIKRLPREVYDARAYRIVRAGHFNAMKDILPEEYWVTYEQDLQNVYLRPYIIELEIEKQEMRNHGIFEWEITRKECDIVSTPNAPWWKYGGPI